MQPRVASDDVLNWLSHGDLKNWQLFSLLRTNVNVMQRNFGYLHADKIQFLTTFFKNTLLPTG